MSTLFGLFVEYSLLNIVTGYGFVDFELAQDAEKAVKALQAQGIQAQMAKVRTSCLMVFILTSNAWVLLYHTINIGIMLI